MHSSHNAIFMTLLVFMALQINHLGAMELFCIPFRTTPCPQDHDLNLAIIHRNTPEALRLIYNGANVCIKDWEGLTPLHKAAQVNLSQVIIALLDSGANVHAQDIYGRTPFHIAAGNGHLKLFALLASCGADVQAKDRNGKTPLHHAARVGWFKQNPGEAEELLLALGAQPNAKDKKGNTPVHLAAQWNHTPTLGALIRAGGDIYCKNKRGKMPIDLPWCYANNTLKTLVTSIAPQDVAHIIPSIIVLKRIVGQSIGKDIGTTLTHLLFQDIVKRKFILAHRFRLTQCLSDLETEIVKNIHEALKKSPHIQLVTPDSKLIGWLSKWWQQS